MLEIASVLFNLSISTIPQTEPYLGVVTNPVLIAHEVKTSKGVGATIHIAPDDRPVAGKKSTIWIALTKRGGQTIPYEKCDCRIEVQSVADPSIKFTLSSPSKLVENYIGVPSLEVTFPQAGRYELRLIGSPKEESEFRPFELTFTTDVSK